jgi:Rps23 Pro-64 3,4-dihydroxylase Tpa1-like proline 4-hydroxylase
MDRVSLGTVIADRLRRNQAALRAQFHETGRIHACVLPGVLDVETCQAIHAAFPAPDHMMERRTLRERKYVSAQMDRYPPLLEEAVYAFQEPPVLDQLRAISDVRGLMPDPHLYAGGISMMRRGSFLNPHVDNSHDHDRSAYRVLNLLYYVTPDWRPEYGGSLQLWDDGPRRPGGRTIPSRFNHLVLMGTTRRSWHSVSPVTHDGARCCLSNYYFAPRPLLDERDPPGQEYFHPTSFRGFPDELVKDTVLRVDAALRAAVRKVRRGGVVPTRHIYRSS